MSLQAGSGALLAQVLPPIRGLPPLPPLPPLAAQAAAAAEAAEPAAAHTGGLEVYREIARDFRAALRRVAEADRRAQELQVQLVRGEPVDLHEVIMQTEEAILQISMAVEIRNRIYEAYQELMRMQV